MKMKTRHFSEIVYYTSIITIVEATLLLLYTFDLVHPYVIRVSSLLYLISLSALLYKWYFTIRAKELAQKLHFDIITHFYQQTKIEGHYKNHWFQIHYRGKETGKDPGILRTYVKLQFKNRMKYNYDMLQAHKGINVTGHHVIIIKHLVRSHKNYLLLKCRDFIFDDSEIKELMNYLIKVHEEAKLE